FQFAEGIDQSRKTPEIDPRLRLIKDEQSAVLPRQNGSDFYSLYLASGQTGVDLTIYVILGAETYLGQDLTDPVFPHLPAGRQLEKIPHRNTFKANRLLKGITDAESCPLCYIHIGNICAIQQHTAPGDLIQS